MIGWFIVALILRNTPELGSNGAAGVGVINIGDTTGSADATLQIGSANVGVTSGLNVNNSLVVPDGSVGTSTISGINTTGVNTFSGNVTLRKNVNLGAATGGTVVFSGLITDDAFTHGINKTGAGTVVLTSANFYDGGTTITAGTLQISADNNLGNAGNPVLFMGDSTLKTTGSFTSARSITLNSSGTVLTDVGSVVTLAGVISGSSGLTKSGAGTLLLSGTNSYTGPTAVADGTLEVQSSLTKTSAINVTGGVLRVAAGAPQPRAIRANSVSVSGGGQIDLTDHALITQSPVGTWNGTTYSDVSGLIRSGRNGGGWGGSGIVTSQTHATTGNFTSIGIAAAFQVKAITGTATALWAGETVGASDVLVLYTYGGDANLDGKLNVDDYVRIDSNVGLWPTNNGIAAWFNGDFNYDGKVNVDDYVIIDSNISIAQPPFPTGSGAGGLNVVAIPEPTTGVTLLACTLAARGRRRRASVA